MLVLAAYLRRQFDMRIASHLPVAALDDFAAEANPLICCEGASAGSSDNIGSRVRCWNRSHLSFGVMTISP
jgi:hypothetical protein